MQFVKEAKQDRERQMSNNVAYLAAEGGGLLAICRTNHEQTNLGPKSHHAKELISSITESKQSKTDSTDSSEGMNHANAQEFRSKDKGIEKQVRIHTLTVFPPLGPQLVLACNSRALGEKIPNLDFFCSYFKKKITNREMSDEIV